MSKSNMNFAVNGNAVVCNIIDGEIRARMALEIIQKKRVNTKNLELLILQVL